MGAKLVCLVAVVVLVASALGQRTCPSIEVTQHQILEPSDGANKSNLFFGKYFRISGDHMVVGAYGTRGFRGAAHFFELINDQWTFVQTVTNDDSAGGDYFGLYVALSGTVAAVSSPYFRTFGKNKLGRVNVYERSGSTWSLLQKLVPDLDVVGSVNSGYSFGYGLGSQGDTIVVGARGADSPTIDRAGSIHIWSRSGAGKKFKIDQVIFGQDKSTQFGDDVAVGGLLPGTGTPKIVVSAPRAKPSERGAGHVFLRNAGTWSLHQTLVPDDSAFSKPDTYKPHFWEGVAFWKDLLFGGGERAASPSGNNHGAVWLWSLKSGQWEQGEQLYPQKQGRFGQRLDVHDLSDGSLVAFVGSWYERESGLQKAGAAYYFVRCDDNTWSRGPRMILDTPAEDDQFGNMVAMSDGWVGIGSPKRDSGAKTDVADRGAVYMYKVTLAGSGPAPTSAPTPTPTSAPSPPDVTCVETDTRCAGWVKNNYCDLALGKPWVPTLCPVSCGLCASCGDGDTRCAKWAGQGHCNNADRPWVAKQCKASCGTC